MYKGAFLLTKEGMIIVTNERLDPNSWNTIYRELAQLVGSEITIQIYQEFKGTQVHFPIRLIRADALPYILENEYNGNNLRELARYYGYSERHLRRILLEAKKDHSSSNRLMEQEIPYVKDIKTKSEEQRKDEK